MRTEELPDSTGCDSKFTDSGNGMRPPLNISSITLGRQYERFRVEIDDAYKRVMARGVFVLGQELTNFESGVR